MGTRSLIARQVGPDEYRTIFCKIEGHLESQGAMLLEHFNSPERVDALLDLGDLYRLHPKLEVTVAYHRDWQCTGLDAEIKPLNELDDAGGMIQFIYIFDMDNHWKYFQGGYLDEGLRDVRSDLQALEQGIDILKPPPFDFLDELLDEDMAEEMCGM